MSFFGFGKSKAPEPEPTPSYTYEEPSYEYSSPAPAAYESHAPSAPSAGVAEVQSMLMEEQQRALIQQAVSKITAIAWDKCSASKPEAELTSREKECIKNVTLAYLDTSMFVVHRVNKSGSA
jgi:mitochondrial import inner membrane translocase subunit TIM8